MPKQRRYFAASMIFLTLLMAASHIAAQTFEVVHTFSGAPSDGARPYAPVVISPQGALIGTTQVGGNAGYCDQATGCGTVYSLQPPAHPRGAWKETVLYNFTGGADGGSVFSPVVMGVDGVLYGVTQNGGTGNCDGQSHGCGVVFSLKPPASSGGTWNETVLHDFTSGATGTFPNSLVLASDGMLYGTTQSGGIHACTDDHGCGTVFSLAPPASPASPWTYQILYKFSASGPNSPLEGLLLRHGVLYGSTFYGGPASNGAVFSLTPPSTAGAPWTFQVLHYFSGAPGDGANPQAAPVMGADGLLYGTTWAGGSGICGVGFPAGCGTVYSLSPPVSAGDAWTETILYNFNSNGVSSLPMATAGVVIGSDGVLYGTASYGGTNNLGFVYSLSPPTSAGAPWSENVLYSFTGGSGGAVPYSNVVIGEGGQLYGTTYSGGYPNVGTVFSLKR